MVTSHPQPGNGERNESMIRLRFPLHTTQDAQGVVPPTVKTALPTPFNILKILLHLPEDSRVYQVDNQYYLGSFCLTGWLTGWLV